MFSDTIGGYEIKIILLLLFFLNLGLIQRDLKLSPTKKKFSPGAWGDGFLYPGTWGGRNLTPGSAWFKGLS